MGREIERESEYYPRAFALLMARRAKHEREALDTAQHEIARLIIAGDEAIDAAALFRIAKMVNHARRFGKEAVRHWDTGQCVCRRVPRGEYQGRCIDCGGPLHEFLEVES